jgi:outer membrane murein-binding lipoprotein Lpp
MAEVSGGEVATIIGAIVGAGVAVGGGIKWAVTTRAGRQKMVDEAVEAVVGDLKAKVIQLEGRVAILTNGCTMLMGEVARHVPDSPVLREANRLFHMAFDVPVGTPDVMADLIDELRKVPSR